jgi:FkbM family methyltransferase
MKLRLLTPIPHLTNRERLPISLDREDPQTMSLTVVQDMSQATHQMISVLGMPLIVHRTEVDEVISGTLSRDGFWEFAESMLLMSIVRPGMTVLDVGANVGYYATLLTRLVGKNGTVHAFEPDPYNFLVLAANLCLHMRLLSEKPRVEFLPLALSDRVGTGRLERYERNLGLHRLTADSNASGNCVPVETGTIDDLRSRSIIAQRIDLIKADIQGSELAMLRGADQTIQADRPALVPEFEPYISSAAVCREVLNWLDSNGYRHIRLFKSDRSDPFVLLQEFSRPLSIAQAAESLSQNRVGAYGTLFATLAGED